MASQRIHSIDVFRGLTIFIMVFVNDVAGVGGLPMWMKHAAADADWMSFVDVVFPAFLFIVGMSIPLAMQRRIRQGQSFWQISRHILSRTAGLLILGLFMVNGAEMNTDANLIPKRLWQVGLYLAAILIWNAYPQSDGKSKLYRGLQILGMLILIGLAFTFRKGSQGEIGLTPSWWGILGLIGWAYLFSVIVYAMTRDNMVGILAVIALFVLITIGLKQDSLTLPLGLDWLSGQAGNFAHATLTLSGLLLSLILQQKDSSKRIIQWMLVAGVLCLLGGFFLRPIYGISKIYATPSWVLFSTCICCWLFPLIYWLVDVKGYRTWATFLSPAGTNPLLTYILPSLFYAIVGMGFFPEVLNHGLAGVLRSLIFSLFILAIAAWMSRAGIRLRL
ncbi:MAG: DUF5009 domain-containing protein [Bacteroidota bacterium]